LGKPRKRKTPEESDSTLLDQKIRREETLHHTNKKINNEFEPATLEDLRQKMQQHHRHANSKGTRIPNMYFS
jgi:hypothetical protein